MTNDMPRCAAHNAPAPMSVEVIVNRRLVSVPMCEQCLNEARGDTRLYVQSQRLIVGGIWTREGVTGT